MLMKFVRNHLLILWILSVFILLLITNSTTPQSVGPGGIALFFGAFYVFCFLSVVSVLKLLFKAQIKVFKDTKVFAGVGFMALVPTIILALQSLGQLIWRDVLILLALCSLAVFYWMKRG